MLCNCVCFALHRRNFTTTLCDSSAHLCARLVALRRALGERIRSKSNCRSQETILKIDPFCKIKISKINNQIRSISKGVVIERAISLNEFSLQAAKREVGRRQIRLGDAVGVDGERGDGARKVGLGHLVERVGASVVHPEVARGIGLERSYERAK